MPSHAVQQLLREWPPGYGGIERVAHELAEVWGGTVWSLDAQCRSKTEQDVFPVRYERRRLPCTPAVGRFVLPLPSLTLWHLLVSRQPLHGHLPSPGVLLLLVMARLFRPRRRVTAHWHFFFEPTERLSQKLFSFYQRFALMVVAQLSGVVTTSPILRQELVRSGCRPDRVFVLPCCLSVAQEHAGLAMPRLPVSAEPDQPLRVLFIGRLGSYKRLDWLMQSLNQLTTPWLLDVVGDGPARAHFERVAFDLLGRRYRENVRFLGRLSESDKEKCLELSDLLVLPSDSSNEAFGIVQLEAMAAGIPALAFQRRRSGMGWVCQLPGLSWSQTPDALAAVLQRLAINPSLRSCLGNQARQRYRSHFARSVWLQTLSGIDAEGF